jgi:hypothetical protein
MDGNVLAGFRPAQQFSLESPRIQHQNESLRRREPRLNCRAPTDLHRTRSPTLKRTTVKRTTVKITTVKIKTVRIKIGNLASDQITGSEAIALDTPVTTGDRTFQVCGENGVLQAI